MARKPRKKRSFVTNSFKVLLKYLPHQGMFFPPANSGGLLIHLFFLPPDPGTFHQMCCNKGVIFTLAILWKFNWIFFPSFFAPEQSKDHDEPDDDDAEPEQAVHNDRPRIPVAVK